VCFFGGLAELWEPFDAATSRLAPPPPELLTILSRTFSDPARLALPVLARLNAAISGLSQETSPARIVRTAIAAVYVDRLPDCRGPLWRVVDNGRGGGAITSAIEALFLLSIDAFVAGQWDELLQFTDEGLELCESHSYRLLSCPGRFVRALVAAARGRDDEVRLLTDEMGGWATPRRVRSVVNYVCHARALLALGHGDFEGAYRNAAAVSPAGTLASHVPHALWLVLELTEAAVRTGRRTEAVAHVAAARDADIASISPRLAFITAAAAALVAPDDRCDQWFEEALAIPGPDRWPFELARVHLAYGERLRRVKATSQAREHLTAARTIFDGLAARPWASRAGSELRAAGVTIGQPDRVGIASLSPQQLEIARLAASGLTNKQIAEKLFLSPRTIGTHLYQLFPKLGVTSRAALRDALKDLAIDP
jgi:DNA-binding CsgD family transcriptional regulator